MNDSLAFFLFAPLFFLFSLFFCSFFFIFFFFLLLLLSFCIIFSISSFLPQPNALMLSQMLLNSFYMCLCLYVYESAIFWTLHIICFLTMSMAFLLCVTHCAHTRIVCVYGYRYTFAWFVCCKSKWESSKWEPVRSFRDHNDGTKKWMWTSIALQDEVEMEN